MKCCQICVLAAFPLVVLLCDQACLSISGTAIPVQDWAGHEDRQAKVMRL